jgi:rSAM/selenodomain-associated transferase 1
LNPAILVFARVPEPGKVKTRLSPPLTASEASRLYAAFVSDTAAKLKSVDAAVRWYVTPDVDGFKGTRLVEQEGGVSFHIQVGESLGARMRSAVQATMDAGCDAIVVIGTDSPTLPVRVLEEALRHLKSPGSAVLGPASDGGYYLLGLHGVDPAFLEEMSYSRSDVFARTSDLLLAETGVSPVVLGEWYDVDVPADLERLTAELESGESVAAETRSALTNLGLVSA